MVIGSSTRADRFFYGDLDEIRISNKARSPGWIRAVFKSEGPDSSLLKVGMEEVGEGGGFLPSFYLGTIAKNITLDGLVIIGILMIFSILSILVFLSKAFFIFLVQRDNRAFLEPFSNLEKITDLEENGGDFQNSSLYRIYVQGCRELKSWLRVDNNPVEETTLPKKAVNAIKTALERGFVQESRRLNAWLVILIMAITGGPFLGLLGTVWGVMNTFAAMAEVGEANIMAIAPGVASALSTTVFGLIVAIPALFGYNYLNGKVKNITADMSIFVDEFSNKVDEAYGEST
jgi:biopolymer transport protein ExbB